MKKIRIILCQLPLGVPITRALREEMRAFGPHFICFPEYFFVSMRLGNHGQTPLNQARQISRIEALSRDLDTVVIGGTMPEIADDTLYNTTFVYQNGERLGFYRKKNLFFAEVNKITPGNEYRVFHAYGITFGVLICADVFYDESFTFMRDSGAKIIFSPTFSLKKDEGAEEKFKRDREIYVRGAGIAGSVIGKVCGVPSPYRDFLQARSLIADNERVIYRVEPDEEDKAMLIKKEVVIG